MGALNAGGVGLNLDSQRISGFLINNCCTVVVYRTCGRLFVYCGYADIGPPSAMRNNQSPSSVAVQCETDQARSPTIHNHGRPWILCMTARLDVMMKTTEQNWIVLTGKSKVKVGLTNKKLRSRYCTIEAMKLTTDRHEALRGLFATSELLVTRLFNCTFVCDLFVVGSTEAWNRAAYESQRCRWTDSQQWSESTSSNIWYINLIG